MRSASVNSANTPGPALAVVASARTRVRRTAENAVLRDDDALELISFRRMAAARDMRAVRMITARFAPGGRESGAGLKHLHGASAR